MIIGTVELLRLVKEKNLVENLCNRELENPEGTGFDLRVGEIFKIKEGQAYLGETDRHTPETESIAKYGKDKEIIIRPGDFVLVKTMEKLNLPNNIAVIFRPRSTLQRCGIALFTATANPGYSGELTFGMKNEGQNELRLEMGARFAHALFFEASEIVSSYRGQWQGGRVSTEGKKETQV
jgi:deoxycytidine triphosphate deaminase